ncbi:MAG TPA: DUF1214 domain-containing protein [Steroidobacteraceae bacterium]|nr:DUF1214 domain-containing protein [Steroidobacteraceae bacterium]
MALETNGREHDTPLRFHIGSAQHSDQRALHRSGDRHRRPQRLYPLDGGKNYKLHLPPNIPVNDFWSVILYSNQTRSMIQTDQRFPSVSSQTKGLQKNPDGSVDVYLGPQAPIGKESNWVQRQFPAEAGTLSCASMARWNRGSQRLGGRGKSSW